MTNNRGIVTLNVERSIGSPHTDCCHNGNLVSIPYCNANNIRQRMVRKTAVPQKWPSRRTCEEQSIVMRQLRTRRKAPKNTKWLKGLWFLFGMRAPLREGSPHSHEIECNLEIIAGQIPAVRNQVRKRNPRGKRMGSYYPLERNEILHRKVQRPAQRSKSVNYPMSKRVAGSRPPRAEKIKVKRIYSHTHIVHR
jgi:hypothetical protein